MLKLSRRYVITKTYIDLSLEMEMIEIQNSHIQIPKCILKEFEEGKSHLFYYDVKLNSVKKGFAKTLNTEVDYYSQEMETFLSKNIETPMGKLINEIKKLDWGEFPIDIPNGMSEVAFEYFNSLIARSNLTFDSVSTESLFIQFLKPQEQHDITVSTMINMKPASKTFDGYLSTLLINFTDEPFVLPAMGAFSYHYYNSRFINIPITPYMTILIIENNEPSRYIIDGKMGTFRIDEVDIVKDINETAFVSELVGNRRWIASPNKKELLELKTNFDKGIFNKLIEKFRLEQ